MSIASKEQVISNLQRHFGVTLQQFPGKQILYGGKRDNGSQIVICTPQSKLHVKGHGWFDLTSVQQTMLEEADVSILAFRLQDDKVYYLNFRDLKPYLTKEAKQYNEHEGDHWKLYIWTDYIQIRGNSRNFPIKPNNFENL